MIDRIDVLTGGASATYGSDAVAGVVNFVMKHNFEGVQLDAEFGVNQHDNHNSFMQGIDKAAGVNVPGSDWDGRSRDYSLVVGANAPDGKAESISCSSGQVGSNRVAMSASHQTP